jgi:dihydrolipoamide dehydrogenase
MERELKKRGVTLCTGTTVDRLERSDTTVTAHLKDGTIITAEKLLVSVGRG